MPLTSEEKGHLKIFQSYLKANRLALPPGYDDSSRNLFRYLQSADFNPEKTFNQVMGHYEWQSSTYPQPQIKYETLLESGVFYIHKRDKQFRPVIILNIERMCKAFETIQVDDLIQFVYFLLHFAATNLMVPGRVE
jgi:hypothetical protein